MTRFNAPLEESAGSYKAHLAHLPTAVKEHLATRGLEDTIRIAFDDPPPSRSEHVSRSHPLPATLAEMLLEAALESQDGEALGRIGAWTTAAVKTPRRSPCSASASS